MVDLSEIEIDEATVGDIEIELDREEARRSFARFARLAWPYVEPTPCVWGWHMDAVCEHLEAVSRGQIRDLVIAIPPGMSKSLLVSTLWPAWDWATISPTRRTIGATYAQPLTEKNATLLRGLVMSDWYAARWPRSCVPSAKPRADVRANRVETFTNASGGWVFSTSVKGTVTGFHADILRGDDLAKAQDASNPRVVDPVGLAAANEMWFSTLHTRRADPLTTRRVLVGQRLHHDDTPGRAIEAGYVALVLPMEYDPKRRCVVSVTGWEDPRTKKGELLDKNRFTPEIVAADRIALGPRAASAQFDQEPTQAGGLLFKDVLDLPRWVPDRNGEPPPGHTIIVCDAAFKGAPDSDYVAIHAWRAWGHSYGLVYRDTRRMGATETARALARASSIFPHAPIYIEDKANGPAIMDTFAGFIPNMIPWSPGADSKSARAESRAHLFDLANPRILLPPDVVAPWLPEYARTMQRFPLDKHDDDVDATSMALIILDNSSTKAYNDALAALASELSGRR